MSRVGKKPITIPAGVTISINADNVAVEGKKGKLSMPYKPEMVKFNQEGAELTVERKNEEKPTRAHHGLYRSLLNGMVEGVDKGFTKTLEIKGVGYRGSVKGKTLELLLGYSHPINFAIPEDVEIKFEEKSQTILHVSGINKQRVGQIAAEIRSFRKPEPYKGKGIRYQDEYILRKAGKSGKA